MKQLEVWFHTGNTHWTGTGSGYGQLPDGSLEIYDDNGTVHATFAVGWQCVFVVDT